MVLHVCPETSDNFDFLNIGPSSISRVSISLLNRTPLFPLKLTLIFFIRPSLSGLIKPRILFFFFDNNLSLSLPFFLVYFFDYNLYVLLLLEGSSLILRYFWTKLASMAISYLKINYWTDANSVPNNSIPSFNNFLYLDFDLNLRSLLIHMNLLK